MPSAFFTSATNISIVVYSGARAEVVPGLLLTA